MKTPWYFEGAPFLSENIDDNFGFVYLITNIQSGKRYIGRKYFWSFRKPPGKKRRVKKESDWKKYYGSCPELKEDIELLGRQNFSRTILSLHKTEQAKQTSKKQNNSSSMESSQNPLTQGTCLLQ